MSFNIALSGLQSTSQDLNTISNNIANASTVGFRGGRSEFSAIYNGGNPGGVNVAGTSQNFSQGGSLTYTGRHLDMGIQGEGFFMLNSTDGSTMYSRAGMFKKDALGYLADPSGNHLRGYSVDANGQLQNGNLADLQIKAGSLPAKASTKVDQVSNLDARVATIDTTTHPFKTDDPLSFNSSSTVTVYDSLGNEHAMTQYFAKTGAAGTNQWTVHYVVDGATLPTTATLNFDKDGKIETTAGTPKPNLDIAVTNGASDIKLALDYTSCTQYAADYSNTSLSQDGYTSGELNGIRLDDSGKIFGTYTNGQEQLQGEVVLANFTNPNGLTPVSNNAWKATSAAGAPVTGAPKTGTLGGVTGGYLESSNVDTTAEMVSLMTAQRNYQSNAKVLDTSNNMQQALLNAI